MTSSLHISQRYNLGNVVTVSGAATKDTGIITDIKIVNTTYIDAVGVHEYTTITYTVEWSDSRYMVVDHDQIQFVALMEVN